jgi:hypothetical protein
LGACTRSAYIRRKRRIGEIAWQRLLDLTGTKFRVDAVIEKFNDMRDDLDKERKLMNRQWAKRETQILAVVESTASMVGDLQAIAGKAMPEIPSLDMPLLERSDAAE